MGSPSSASASSLSQSSAWGFPICWSLVPFLSGSQRLPRARFPQSCAGNFKVLQNQMFSLALAVYQIPIRPYKFLRQAPAQQFFASSHLGSVRWLNCYSSHLGRKELIKSPQLLETLIFSTQTRGKLNFPSGSYQS